MSLDPKDFRLVILANEAAIAGKEFTSDVIIFCESERTFWYAHNGAAPARTTLAAASTAQSSATASVSDVAVGDVHSTVITLTNLSVPIVSVTSGNGVGGVKLFDFPAGVIRHLGSHCELSLAVPPADQADYTDATPEGDISLGSVIVADADALGTDTTDDDFATATAFVMAAYADTSVILPSEAQADFDGRVTPVDANLNVLVDAVDINDDATTTVTVSGKVTINWVFLGGV